MEDCKKNKAKLSFILEDETTFKTVNTVEELRQLVADCRKNGRALSKYDFSNLDVIDNVCFDRLVLEDVVFSRFRPCCNKRPLLFQLSFMGATLRRISFAHANLLQCNFDTIDENAHKQSKIDIEGQDGNDINKDNCKEIPTILEYADFFYSNLEYCRFRKTYSNYVDFRYSNINNCTLGEYEVKMGDFYCCNFLGSTNFIDSEFENCSFTNATFEHACIRMDNIRDGIVQENSDDYHNKFINNKGIHWYRYNPCFSFSSMNHFSGVNKEKSDAAIASESMNFYKQMSGVFAGKGLNRDSNKAYAKKVLEERKYSKAKLVELKKEKDCKAEPVDLKKKEEKKDEEEKNKEHGKWYYRRKLCSTYAIQWMGYGYKLLNPFLGFLLIVIVFWMIFQFVDCTVCINTPEWLQHIGYSLNNALSPFEDYYKVVNIFISALQSTLGVLIVGFLGFVVANKVRNNS